MCFGELNLYEVVLVIIMCEEAHRRFAKTARSSLENFEELVKLVR
jgi:hypothetical protein